jgi:hypothetical protein
MGWLLVTLAIPIRIAEALDTLVPLPMTIYRFLLDSATGQGVQGPRVRVVGAVRTLVAKCPCGPLNVLNRPRLRFPPVD